MIHELKIIIGESTDPHYNLSLEEYLLQNIKKGECILYLWQNEKTVVIGRNQNALKECRVKELEEDGGTLVRRMSGGGAVFHDLGNLNFTFLVNKEDYDVDKQLQVILEAVRSFGIQADKSGRNDITVYEKKFSGNAFYQEGEKCYHHGTILVAVDMNKLSHYLNVSREKLVAKGVESVKARVTNLSEFSKEVTIDTMKDALIKAFERVYERPLSQYDFGEVEEEELKALVKKFSSWDYKYGKNLTSNYSLERKFSWGMLQLMFDIKAGKVEDAAVYTDALDIEIPEIVKKHLIGSIFSSKELINSISPLLLKPDMEVVGKDIISLFEEENL